VAMGVNKSFLARLVGVDESDISSIIGHSFELDKVPERLDSFESLIHDRLHKRIEALGAVISKEDDLGKVVRAHIYVEHELQDFIFFAAPFPEHLKALQEYRVCRKG
jgi:hypothetical protein